MEITQAQADKLYNFLGYGNLNAPFWFLGMEEGTGGKEGGDKIEWNINIRLQFFEEVMDLREAHDSNRLHWEYWDPTKRIRFPSVWMYMARMVRALGDEGASDWWDNQKAKTYIREHLARKQVKGKTFLTELLPLPKPSAKSWPDEYKSLFLTLEEYEESIWTRRKGLLRQAILNHKPTYLFCYGRKNHARCKELVDVTRRHWESPTPGVEVGLTDSTCVILTPFLGNGAVSRYSIELLVDYLQKLRRSL